MTAALLAIGAVALLRAAAIPPSDPACAAGCSVGPTRAAGPYAANMNGDYTITVGRDSTVNRTEGFTTLSSDYDRGNVEYFDVYSPLVKTRYSQVYWTMMDSVPLPPALVQRFAGKTMAITGWESDQVVKGVDGKPDTSIPITWACVLLP